jgi:hypothetical protein
LWKRQREDKSVLTEPRCPFCNALFERPYEIPTEFGFFTGGTCVCGAVYGFDPTGKNLGEIYMDVLVQVCNGDWQRAMNLSRGESYEERVLRYNFRNHQLVPSNSAFGRRTGVLLFLKLTGN